MAAFGDILGLYDYPFPRESIARAPADPRDSARLLVYRRATGETTDTTFRDLAKYLPPQSVLVFNETKVIPAKLTLWRITRAPAPLRGAVQGAAGGMVSLLILGRSGELLRALADKKLHIGEMLPLPGGHSFTVDASDGNEWFLLPTFPAERWMEACEEIGEMPLPPYIKDTPLSPADQRKAYQSVFARDEGSVAAPTASLHFTERLLGQLRRRGTRSSSLRSTSTWGRSRRSRRNSGRRTSSTARSTRSIRGRHRSSRGPSGKGGRSLPLGPPSCGRWNPPAMRPAGSSNLPAPRGSSSKKDILFGSCQGSSRIFMFRNPA